MNVQILFVFLALVAAAYSSCPAVDGEFAVILPNRRDCSSFFICAHGTPVAFECPAGLEFNARLSVCDWPASAGCVATTTRRPRPTTTTRRPRPTWTPRPTTTTRRPRPTWAPQPTTTTRRPKPTWTPQITTTEKPWWWWWSMELKSENETK